VEDAIKAIMSVGIVTPQTLSVPLSNSKPEKESVEKSEGLKYLNSKMEGGS
jgi:uncharacterized membrane protein